MTQFGSQITASAFPKNTRRKQHIDEDALGAAMFLLAKKEGQRASGRSPAVRMDNPSPRELQALQALKGSMTSVQVAAAMGEPNTKGTAGFLSGLATKGFVERVGCEGKLVVWRKTRKGRKWTA